MAAKILVVDDEHQIVRFVRAYLEREGFQVFEALDGDTALTMIALHRPDLVILDLMLPGLSGEEICEYVRDRLSVPIIMLTAKVNQEDRIKGLELGADDYVVKPFDPRELVARVKAVLRRSLAKSSSVLYSRTGNISLDLTSHKVFVKKQEVTLTPTEFRLLALFMRNPQRVFSRTEIVDRLFGPDYDGYEESIYVHINNLRRKVDPDGTLLRTVYGVGYRWEDADEEQA